MLRLICQEQFRRSSFCETPTREFNHISAIWLHSFEFLLVFFVVLAGIILLGEVNRIVTQLITRGVVVLILQGWILLILIWFGVLLSEYNDSYPEPDGRSGTHIPIRVSLSVSLSLMTTGVALLL